MIKNKYLYIEVDEFKESYMYDNQQFGLGSSNRPEDEKEVNNEIMMAIDIASIEMNDRCGDAINRAWTNPPSQEWVNDIKLATGHFVRFLLSKGTDYLVNRASFAQGGMAMNEDVPKDYLFIPPATLSILKKMGLYQSFEGQGGAIPYPYIYPDSKSCHDTCWITPYELQNTYVNKSNLYSRNPRLIVQLVDEATDLPKWYLDVDLDDIAVKFNPASIKINDLKQYEAIDLIENGQPANVNSRLNELNNKLQYWEKGIINDYPSNISKGALIVANNAGAVFGADGLVVGNQFDEFKAAYIFDNDKGIILNNTTGSYADKMIGVGVLELKSIDWYLEKDPEGKFTWPSGKIFEFINNYLQPISQQDIGGRCFIPWSEVGQLIVVDVLNREDGETSILGELSKLTTGYKKDLVGAINEINAKAPPKWDPNGYEVDPTYGAYIHGMREKNWSGWLHAKDVGETKNLTTTNKVIVDAINELNGKLATARSLIDGVELSIQLTDPADGKQKWSVNLEENKDYRFKLTFTLDKTPIAICGTVLKYSKDVQFDMCSLFTPQYGCLLQLLNGKISLVMFSGKFKSVKLQGWLM